MLSRLSRGDDYLVFVDGMMMRIRRAGAILGNRDSRVGAFMMHPQLISLAAIAIQSTNHAPAADVVRTTASAFDTDLRLLLLTVGDETVQTFSVTAMLKGCILHFFYLLIIPAFNLWLTITTQQLITA